MILDKNKINILGYLRSRYIMGLTSSDNKGNLWPATVYYIVDDDMNLYFMSNPKTLHGRNISENSHVACTIADSDQKMSDDKVGIQLSGSCERVKGVKYIKILASSYKKSNLKVGSLTLDAFKKAATSGIYKVTPNRIKFFNTILYTKEKFIEIKL